jgi:energy-coupling factor transporter transmembrane protein EcfT
MHPLAKLMFLLGVASAAMRSTSGVLLALFAFGLLALMRLPKVAGGALMSIALLTVFAALTRGMLPGDGRLFDAMTLPASGLYALRLLTVYVYSRLFYATTRVGEIGDWMTAAARLFRRVFLGKTRSSSYRNDIRGDPGILFSLALLFLPRIFDTYQRIKEAGEVRGIQLSRRNVRRSLLMLEQLIVGSMVQAWRTAEAMEARGYSPLRTLQLRAFKVRDVVLLAIGAGLFFF